MSVEFSDLGHVAADLMDELEADYADKDGLHVGRCRGRCRGQLA